jgi:hypothetical protein
LAFAVPDPRLTLVRSSSWGTRLVAAFITVATSFVVTTEAAGLHACPVHDAALVNSAVHEEGHGDHAPAAETDAPHSSDEGEAGHGCHCLGPCSAAGPVALPAAAEQLGEIPLAASQTLRFSAVSRQPAQPAHTLPFSIGPPAAV